MKFTAYLWEQALPVYEKIEAHPFNIELMAGSLPKEKFKQYIYQDSLYLAEFARALAVTGSRAPFSHDFLDFLGFAQNAVLVERALHESYFSEYHIEHKDGMSPACFAYTHYLLTTSSFESFEVAVAALLPCFWIYKKVGDFIYNNQSSPNPYQQWISTYSGDEFAKSVQKALDICDRAAEQASESTRLQMTEAYITASRLEYMFWDSAYRLEKWMV